MHHSIFLNHRTFKQPKCPLVANELNRQVYLHTLEWIGQLKMLNKSILIDMERYPQSI